MASIGNTPRLASQPPAVTQGGRSSQAQANGAKQENAFLGSIQKMLSKAASLDPRTRVPNSPELIRSEVGKARLDGKVTVQEAKQLQGVVAKNSTTPTERKVLKEQLDRYSSSFEPAAKKNLERFLRDTEPADRSGVSYSGGVRISARGVRQSAIDEANRLTREMTKARPDIAQRLKASGHVLVIVPEKLKLTDMPGFQSLRGQTSIDGRPYDGMRGVSTMSHTAVAEENLSELSTDKYGGDFSTGVHEFAHAIHHCGVGAQERQAIQKAYEAQKARGGLFTDAHARKNVDEYFGQLTNAYFGRNQPQSQSGAQWVQKNDPQAYALLRQIYGPPRQL
ncbi:hypothetical protein [Corallococcus exercitus]|uniref:Uncharacterized protein n=1 Tax=Corallococcus exercitus TaxID=2316736 RepID=A0A7Y4KDW3_9BACT|nr:hypothetical protein [Corallococcus exercitus]NOK31872.1 hypothetical protein [Corallococcus exercitus]